MIHQTLKEIRKERKMSIQQESDITNIPFRTIERLESCETKLYVERLEILAKTYNMVMNEVILKNPVKINSNVENCTGNNIGVTINCTITVAEKELHDKLLLSNKEFIDSLKRQISLLEKLNK